ncbi:hypothetical protein PIB30_048302 [Stylosanthes scabra]|uniref:Putative plant transposon protein domain-containing protein n=1 Tax=Stylosanthes scabra TaxID=79078 RepID=A0ABU6WGQ7_9FABA|nr:hypothetical protein [Stylosanthes scabra]
MRDGRQWRREEFYGNFSASGQTHVLLRGKRIPFSEEDICNYLGISYELPPSGEDNIFKKIVTAEKEGMGVVLQVISKEGVTWANDLGNSTIPRRLDNAILNAKATAWHKLIMANIDPKTHGTNFLIEHALLIYVLMIEGVVNLPWIMRDVMLKRPIENSCHLLPYPIFISRLAAQFEVPEFLEDDKVKIWEHDKY